VKGHGFFGLLFALVIFSVPFGLVHVYTRNIVSASLLRRDIQMAGLKKEQLLKKNMALKEAISRFTGRDMVVPGEGLPFSENNRIVRLRLDREAAEASVPADRAVN
jgi:hypothetical protein